MSKKAWKEHEEIEDLIQDILLEGPMSINMIKTILESSDTPVSYGLVKRRMEEMQKAKIVKIMPINHQVKFWKLV